MTDVNRFLQTSLSLALALAASVATLSPVAAQQYYGGRNSDVLLVTPDGRILDQMPEQGDVVMTRDRSGHRVLVDRYGNLIATEMRASSYYPKPPSRNGYNAGGYNSGGGAADRY